MIGFLRGRVAYIYPDMCLLDVNGVGYRIFASANTLGMLAKGQEAELFTYLSVREDALQLYGFSLQDEYVLFQQLLSVSGIGPKVALGVVGAITPGRLCEAINKKQLSVLTKLPGIGKKSAERMILELKDKLHFAGDASDREIALFDSGEPAGNIMSEAMEALMSLGFSRNEITGVLEGLGNTEEDLEGIIKKALKALSGR